MVIPPIIGNPHHSGYIHPLLLLLGWWPSPIILWNHASLDQKNAYQNISLQALTLDWRLGLWQAEYQKVQSSEVRPNLGAGVMCQIVRGECSLNIYTPEKLTWLAGKSPFSIGNTSSFMVFFPASHVSELGGDILINSYQDPTSARLANSSRSNKLSTWRWHHWLMD